MGDGLLGNAILKTGRIGVQSNPVIAHPHDSDQEVLMSKGRDKKKQNDKTKSQKSLKEKRALKRAKRTT